jgi:hypothetical protein
MSRLSLIRMRPGKRSRRLLLLLALALLCLLVVMTVAGTALAAENNSTSNPNVKTSAGLEAPKLDYKFVWWTFILTFGLLIVYYFLVLKISYTEFTKIVEAHFGPKRDGR